MSEHQGGTDSVTKVKLTSAVEQVMWANAFASPGGTVGLEVFTQFVGDGAEMQIELSDASNKKFGPYKNKLTGNRFWATIQVPREARDALFAEVKLPKHGLTKKSGPLLLGPYVQLTNLKWDKAHARRGDILKLTAEVKGAYDGMEAEISIWEHDADGAHDLITRFPSLIKKGGIQAEWEFEYHEDTDDIPTQEESRKGYSAPEYFFRVGVHGVSADSPLLPFKDWIDVVLTTPEGEPVPDEKYVLTFADGTEREGKLDREGRAREEDVPPGKVSVIFPDLQVKSPADDAEAFA